MDAQMNNIVSQIERLRQLTDLLKERVARLEMDNQELRDRLRKLDEKAPWEEKW